MSSSSQVGQLPRESILLGVRGYRQVLRLSRRRIARPVAVLLVPPYCSGRHDSAVCSHATGHAYLPVCLALDYIQGKGSNPNASVASILHSTLQHFPSSIFFFLLSSSSIIHIIHLHLPHHTSILHLLSSIFHL